MVDMIKRKSVSVFMKNNLIYSDGYMYLTVNPLIEITCPGEVHPGP